MRNSVPGSYVMRIRRTAMRYGYARVSTLQQDTALQRAAFAKAGVRKVIEEKRSAGGARPLLDDLLSKLRPGDVLVVYKMDRLARSLSDLLRILRVIRGAGAAFRSLTEPMETETPAGELLLHLLGAFAQFERAMIRERCMAGRAAARERGVRFGRPPTISAEDVCKLRAKGLAWAEIARRVGAGVSSVRRAGLSLRVCDGGAPEKRASNSFATLP